MTTADAFTSGDQAGAEPAPTDEAQPKVEVAEDGAQPEVEVAADAGAQDDQAAADAGAHDEQVAADAGAQDDQAAGDPPPPQTEADELPVGVRDDPMFGAGVWRIVAFAGVHYALPDPSPELVFRETEPPWRELRMPVGMPEGNAIAYAWRGITLPRPFTHDLLIDVLERHRTVVEVLRITAHRNGVYFAELETSGPNGREIFPCRPSDGVAVVLRARPPAVMLVADWVFAPSDD